MESTKSIDFTVYYNDFASGSGGIVGSEPTNSALVYNVGTWLDKTWSRSNAINSRTSTLFFKHGHFASVELTNTGDADAFKVHSLSLHAVFRGHRLRQLFGLKTAA